MNNIEEFDAIKLVKVGENTNLGITKYSFSEETADQNYIWLNKRNEYHNPGGPAVYRRHAKEKSHSIGIYVEEIIDSCFKYFNNGRLHRADGPAVIYGNGEEEYWINGVPHRDGGPAQYGATIEREASAKRTASETKLALLGRTERWMQNGRYHRDGGMPALSIYQSLAEVSDSPALVQTVCYENDIITNENGPAICIYDYSIINNEIIVKKREQYWLHGYWISKKIFDAYHAAGCDKQLVIDDYNRRAKTY